MTNQKHLVATLLLFICQPLACDLQRSENKQVTVVFRYDDCSALSPTDLEVGIIEAFHANNATVTFGLVPFAIAGDIHDPSPRDTVPFPREKWESLKAGSRDGTMEIALHGYSHQTRSATTMTEFSGLAFADQRERLSKGMQFLKTLTGIRVTTFVPPWNSYDFNTLRALETLGFSTLSADLGSAVPEGANLTFLPATTGLERLQTAIDAARASADPHPIVVVLFHPYDFVEVGDKRATISLKGFTDLLTRLKRQGDIRLLAVNQTVKAVSDLSASRFRANHRERMLAMLVPLAFQDAAAALTYRQQEFARTSLLRLAVVYIPAVCLAVLVSLVLDLVVFPKYARLGDVVGFATPVLSTLLLIVVFHDLKVGPRGMMAAALAVGASVGFVSSRFSRRKSRTNVQRQTTGADRV